MLNRLYYLCIFPAVEKLAGNSGIWLSQPLFKHGIKNFQKIIRIFFDLKIHID